MYFWFAVSCILSHKLVQGILIEVLTLNSMNTLAFVFYSICALGQAYVMYINYKPGRKLALLISAVYMIYVSLQVYLRAGFSVVIGVFITLAMMAMFTLWRFTANESHLD
jgi:hypothetical protein